MFIQEHITRYPPFSRHQTLVNLILNDVALVADVNTIEELTDILVADKGGGVDISADLGDGLDVVTGEDDLTLDVGVAHGHALTELDLAVVLVTEELADDKGAVLINNLHGKVVVDELHLVEETLGDADHHVVDVGSHGAAAGLDSLGAEPHLSADGLALVHELDVDVEVVEVLDEGTTGASDGHGAASDLDLNYTRENTHIHANADNKKVHTKKKR